MDGHTMTRRTVRGYLDTAALQLLHRPPGAAPIADARHATRRALSAVRSVEPGSVSADTWESVGRVAATLADLAADLEDLERRVQGGVL
jgi:hypothetical protein